jgi:catechol 2,3-dioxygenase-like lactoylglutathione lyase family enzyme
MAIRLNHTIVRVSDKRESAAFLTEILGCRRRRRTDRSRSSSSGDVSLDFAEAVMVRCIRTMRSSWTSRISTTSSVDQKAHLPYWADPFDSIGRDQHRRRRPRRVLGGSNGHMLEIITRPYGSGEGSEASSYVAHYADSRMFRLLPSVPDHPALEEEILSWWEERRTFETAS